MKNYYEKVAQEILNVLVQNNVSPRELESVLNETRSLVWEVAVIPTSCQKAQ